MQSILPVSRTTVRIVSKSMLITSEIGENVYQPIKKQLYIGHFKLQHESDSTSRIISKKNLNFLKKLKFLLGRKAHFNIPSENGCMCSFQVFCQKGIALLCWSSTFPVLFTKYVIYFFLFLRVDISTPRSCYFRVDTIM